MFDPTSRYAQCEVTTHKVSEPDGTTREIRNVRRRFIPSGNGSTTLVEHTVTQSERLDNITAGYLGDPTLFWKVCDANNAMDPGELEELGRVVRIALPGF